jgi:hypothetical protein
MSCHTTTLEILDTFIIFLLLVPKETHVNTFKLFLDIFNAAKVQLSVFFWSTSSNQILFICNYNIHYPNPIHIFQYSKKSSNLAFFITKKPTFTSSAYIKYTPHHLISSLPRNHPFNLLVEIWSTKLMKKFHWTIEIVFHLRN